MMMHPSKGRSAPLKILFLGHSENPLVQETAASLRRQIETDAEIVLEDFEGVADLKNIEAENPPISIVPLLPTQSQNNSHHGLCTLNLKVSCIN